ncbi:type II CRISPR-associated endonuclease Cas1 [Mycoplasma sp. 3398]
MKKIIDVTESEYLSLFLGNLIIKKEQGKITIPTNDIDSIIFENNKTTISIPLINKFIKEKVNIIICNEKHLPQAQIIPFDNYYNNKVFLSQLTWDENYKAITWKNIIKLKISNQLNLLVNFNLVNDEDYQKFKNYILDVKIGDLSNREAHAAKLYYKNIFGADFKRERNNFDDDINAMLNYGYTILLSFYSRAINGRGFDNRIGVFHKSFNNPYSLACDLMEIARVFVDYVVYQYLIKKANYQEVNWKIFKQMLYEFFDEHINVDNKHIRIRDYIDYSVKKILENCSLEELIIDWNSK